MKKIVLLLIALCLLFAGCGKMVVPTPEAPTAPEVVVDTTEEPTEPIEEVPTEEVSEPIEEIPTEAPASAATVMPLPDTTMDDLDNAILTVSFEEGDVYVDENGTLQMDVEIYAYDRYDILDISLLQVGDTLSTHFGDVVITSLTRGENEILHVNGGLTAGGFDLYTPGTGIYFEVGFNDALSWYPVGNATIPVSVDFEGRDYSDPMVGEILLYPGSFLNGEVTNFNFNPRNTTVRVENGQIVELIRSYLP